MRDFDMIRLLVQELEPSKTRIHLAGRNGISDPLEEFLDDQSSPPIDRAFPGASDLH